MTHWLRCLLSCHLSLPPCFSQMDLTVDLTFCSRSLSLSLSLTLSLFLPLSLQADVFSEASSVKSACSWSLSSQLGFPLPSSPAVNRLLSLPCPPFSSPCLLLFNALLLPVQWCGVYVGITRIHGKHCISNSWSGSLHPFCCTHSPKMWKKNKGTTNKGGEEKVQCCQLPLGCAVCLNERIAVDKKPVHSIFNIVVIVKHVYGSEKSETTWKTCEPQDHFINIYTSDCACQFLNVGLQLFSENKQKRKRAMEATLSRKVSVWTLVQEKHCRSTYMGNWVLKMCCVYGIIRLSSQFLLLISSLMKRSKPTTHASVSVWCWNWPDSDISGHCNLWQTFLNPE